MNKLVHSVIWPAVAGNVLWAFLQVAAGPVVTCPALWPRLFSLLFVGVYLSIDWVNTDKVIGTINKNYWRYDVSLAASIATFAIATQSCASWAPFPLALAFAVAVIGHCNGAWDADGQSSSCKARAALAGMNALGLAVLLIGWFFNESVALWSMPGAILLVVVLFLSLRKRVAML